MANYYDELLKLCGFEDDEIKKEKPRIDKAFLKLGLGPEDMKTAEQWVKENHDVGLTGVRKILGMWLKELIDLVLAKDDGKKLVYYGFPSIAGPAMAIAAASEEIYCTCPDVVICYAMGQIFNKLTPILEAGEQNGLPAGHALCSLQQVRVGALAKGIIPIPDMVLTSSYYCDMGSKADELLHERYHHPTLYIDGSMDSRWGEFPAYLPERVAFLGGEINEALDGVKEILGVEVTAEARYEGASRGREVFAVLGELVELMKEAAPQPISINTVELARRLPTGSASRRIMTDAPKAITILIDELKERVNKGIGVVEGGAPRVMIFLGPFSDPRILHMVENSGLCVSGTLNAFLATKLRKPMPFISGEILADVEMASGIYHSTYGLAKRAAEAAQDSNVDGVIWNYLFHCRPISLTSHLVKQFVERETGIPVLSLEFDLADSSTYSAEALRTRVETFADILRAKKASLKS